MNNEEEINFETIEEVVERQQLPNQAPRINWGPDFEERPDDEKMAFLKKFANSFNHALDLMQKERDALRERCNHLEKQEAQHRASITAQRGLIQKTTQDLNEVKQVYQERINKLEQKIRDLL